MPSKTPVEIELYSHFIQHRGPKLEAAGLRVQFHGNQAPGIHFKLRAANGYCVAIKRGIEEGMASRFPDFLETGSVWVTEITEHPIDSSEHAFYRAARSVIEQAYALAALT